MDRENFPFINLMPTWKTLSLSIKIPIQDLLCCKNTIILMIQQRKPETTCTQNVMNGGETGGEPNRAEVSQEIGKGRESK